MEEADREVLKAPTYRGEGEDGRPKARKAKVALLNTQEAAAYLGVHRYTIHKYQAEGKLKPVRKPKPGKPTLYSSTDLDRFRIARTVGNSHPGKPQVEAERIKEDFDRQLMQLVEKGSSGIVKEALEAGKSDGELQRTMRQQVAGLIVNNKLLEKAAVLALHPRPDIQLKAIATLVSYVLPRLHSTEVVMKQDPAEEKFRQELKNKMDQLTVDMQKARLIDYGPKELPLDTTATVYETVVSEDESFVTRPSEDTGVSFRAPIEQD